MPGAERVLWEGKFWGGTDQRIVGYGVYRYKGRSGAEGEWFVVGLAAQKNYLSLYVNAATEGTPLPKLYAPRLGKVKAGSANLQFKRAADIDLDVLRELVARAQELAPDSLRPGGHVSPGTPPDRARRARVACSPASSGGIQEYG